MIESPAAMHKAEWAFNKSDSSGAPQLGVSLSGGGNRSAAFSIGVLRALHEKGLLDKIDVISAVSGGTYALSWYLLQPYYLSQTGDSTPPMNETQRDMFDPECGFQKYLGEHAKPMGASDWFDMGFTALLTLVFSAVAFNALRPLLWFLSAVGGGAQVANLINASSLARDEYRKGIQKTYQILWDAETEKALNMYDPLKRPQREYVAHLVFTDVLPVTFPAMRDFARRTGVPSFIFNTTVRPPRPGASVPLAQRIFELTPIGMGSDSCGYVTWDDTEGLGWEPGMVPKGERRSRWALGREQPSPFATIRNFNIAPAISGAALSGTNIEGWRGRVLHFANLGLEYVVPNPGDKRRTVRLSDGGHSENLGAYALLRRRCRKIVIVDAEHDPNYQFNSYRKLKAAARAELGIDLEVPSIDEGTFSSAAPVCSGVARAEDGTQSKIYYVKLSMDATLLGDQSETINAYAKKHEKFPQETTADQYFEPAQFVAYRDLGYAVARTLPSLQE